MRDIKTNSIEVRATVLCRHPSVNFTDSAINDILDLPKGDGAHVENIFDKPYLEARHLVGMTPRKPNKKRKRGVRI